MQVIGTNKLTLNQICSHHLTCGLIAKSTKRHLSFFYNAVVREQDDKKYSPDSSSPLP